ncbi:immunity 22 family protein [Thalassococcus sp. S3]|uniref:immunity 22 family protein n=1 Tax=Thalassococcus sp. S3 TaxID=2017482 RepID=UPI0013EE5F10|nr:immunity 22 family protein [Thalassococcus sp. S3]
MTTAFFGGGAIEIVLSQDGQLLHSETVDVPKNYMLTVSVELNARGLLARMLGRGPVRIVEVERRDLGSNEPEGSISPRSLLRSQFWFGTARDLETFNTLMAERDDYYSEENEDVEGTREVVGLSAFADAQGEQWYDHDFLEYGFARQGDDLESRFAGHSWVTQWAPRVRERIDPVQLQAVNIYVSMLIDDNDRFGDGMKIAEPRDIVRRDLVLRYLGEIEFEDR